MRITINHNIVHNYAFKSILLTLSISLLIVSNYVYGGNDDHENYQNVFSTEIPYGLLKDRINKQTLGVLIQNDLPTRGPESFSNDGEGNFYICDTVNRRIQIYSQEGNFRSEVVLKDNIVPNDVVIDDRKILYVYDDAQRKLHQIDKSGVLMRSINVDASQLECRSAMHIIHDDIYIKTCDQDDVLVGKIKNALLEAPTIEDNDLSSKNGILGLSGKRYLVKLSRWEKGEILIYDSKGLLIKLVDLPLIGILSIKFLSEDNNGNFYVQTERSENNIILLEVQKYNSSGNLLCSVLIPENEYKIWSVKLLSIDKSGSIWQLFPQTEKARLNIFKQIDELKKESR